MTSRRKKGAMEDPKNVLMELEKRRMGRKTTSKVKKDLRKILGLTTIS